MPKFEILVERVTTARAWVTVDRESVDDAIKAAVDYAEHSPSSSVSWEYDESPVDLVEWKHG